jgi:hypothetical protein
MARNLALVGLGNLVGGAVLVGAAYAYGVRAPRAAPQVARWQAQELDEAAEPLGVTAAHRVVEMGLPGRAPHDTPLPTGEAVPAAIR